MLSYYNSVMQYNGKVYTTCKEHNNRYMYYNQLRNLTCALSGVYV